MQHAVSASEAALDELLVGDRALWADGPPHELFARLRRDCPVHWSARIPGFPDEGGFWSVTTFDLIQQVNRDWATYSSERGGTLMFTDALIPVEQARLMFVAQDPPKHDRIKRL